MNGIQTRNGYRIQPTRYPFLSLSITVPTTGTPGPPAFDPFNPAPRPRQARARLVNTPQILRKIQCKLHLRPASRTQKPHFHTAPGTRKRAFSPRQAHKNTTSAPHQAHENALCGHVRHTKNHIFTPFQTQKPTLPHNPNPRNHHLPIPLPPGQKTSLRHLTKCPRNHPSATIVQQGPASHRPACR